MHQNFRYNFMSANCSFNLKLPPSNTHFGSKLELGPTDEEIRNRTLISECLNPSGMKNNEASPNAPSKSKIAESQRHKIDLRTRRIEFRNQVKALENEYVLAANDEDRRMVEVRLSSLRNQDTHPSNTLLQFKSSVPAIQDPAAIFEQKVLELTIEDDRLCESWATEDEELAPLRLERGRYLMYLSRFEEALSDLLFARKHLPKSFLKLHREEWGGMIKDCLDQFIDICLDKKFSN